MLDESVFRLERGDFITAEADVLMGVYIQMNMDLTVISRNGYQLLDLFSDVGGLRAALLAGFSFLL